MSGAAPRASRAPVVDAYRVLERGDDVGVLEMVCPYCDRLHYHGGAGGPGHGDGHRVAHCQHPASGPGYVLREVSTREGRSPLRHREPYLSLVHVDLRAAAALRREISIATRTRILERDGFRCRRCGAEPADARLEVDHIVPLARGGSGADENLQTLCTPCNQGKSARAPHPHDRRAR